jgi:hypothetical protein
MEDTGCPERGCTMPAEILDRAVLASTDGPIEHVRVLCLAGHGFFMPMEMLEPERADLRGADQSVRHARLGKR